LMDGISTIIAFAAAYYLRFYGGLWGLLSVGEYFPAQYLAFLLVVILTWMICFREAGLYRDIHEGGAEEFFRICGAVILGMLLLAGIGFFYRGYSYSRGFVIAFIPLNVILLKAGRAVCRRVLRYLARRGVWVSPVLIVGAGPLCERLAAAINKRGTSRVVGYLDDAPGGAGGGAGGSPSIPGASADPIAAPDAPAAPGAAGTASAAAGGSEGAGGGSGRSAKGGEAAGSEGIVATGAGIGGEKNGSIGLDCPRLGGVADLSDVAARYGIEEVLIARPRASREEVSAVVEECYRCHVRWRLVPDIYDLMLEHTDLSLIGDIPLLGTRGSRIVGLNFVVKRLFDIVVSLLLLMLLAPIMLAIAAAIRLTGPGPVFFRQERVGYRGRRFQLLKFRSMRQEARPDDHREYVKEYIAGRARPSDDGQFKLTGDPRVTPVGRFIRRFSLDELPQLFNVLKGDMSLIGPRPPVPYEVEAYDPRHLRRLDVLPGISGLWQVSGRNRLTFEEMVRLDLYYMENWSLGLDLRIFFKTIPAVLFSRTH
ncbi:MAG: sugar transferase, partial [Planctomycetota bacterium]|nr:sugar transferase [Planctomycetota bacterium]